MKISAKARAKLGALAEARQKWDHVHALVERAASRHSGVVMMGRGEQDGVAEAVKRVGRASKDVAELLAAHGFVLIADDAHELVQLARKGEGIQRAALHRMKEIVVNVGQSLQVADVELRRGETHAEEEE